MRKVSKSICIIIAIAFALGTCLTGCTMPGSGSDRVMTDLVSYTVPEGWTDEEIDAPSERAIYKEGTESYIGLFVVDRKDRDQWTDEKKMKQKYKVGKLVKHEIVEDVTYSYEPVAGCPGGIVEESYHTTDDDMTRWAKHCEAYFGDEECLLVLTKTTSQDDNKVIEEFIKSLKLKD